MKAVRIRVNKKEVRTLCTQDGAVVGETDKKAGCLTLLPADLRAEIDAGVWDEGLCVRRFSENITVDALPLLKKGDRIKAGTLEAVVSEAGKTCFPECRFVQRGTSCPLAARAVFLAITADGQVRTGDSVTVEEA